MDAFTLEQLIYELEGIRIVFRTPWNTQFGEYPYERRAAGNTSVNSWFNQRVAPLIDGAQTILIDGSGRIPHGRTHMDTIRNSYRVD